MIDASEVVVTVDAGPHIPGRSFKIEAPGPVGGDAPTWSRRVVAYASGGCGIHEVHCDAGGVITHWTVEPSEAVDGVLTDLETAIGATFDQSRAALLRPVLAERDLPGWQDEDPTSGSAA